MKLTKRIKRKFKMLELKENKSTKKIETAKIKEVEQHVNAIETRMEEIRDLKGKIEYLSFFI